MNARLEERLNDPQVRHDVEVMGDFVAIWCRAKHAALPRAKARTDAALLGVYGRKHPVVCAECESHLAYAEHRRAYCKKSPKPYCSHCDSQCYSASEQEWQRQMMRFSGPRSWAHGHALDGIRHALEGLAYRRDSKRQTSAAIPMRPENEEAR